MLIVIVFYGSLFEYIIIDYEHFICYLLIQF